jgi:Cu(I)/Ag(I) efflux system protein CusF
MKLIRTLSLVVVLSTAGLAAAQSAGMKDMDMNNMDMKHCMDMKEMKDMDIQKCKDMHAMGPAKGPKDTAHKVMTHNAVGVVKAVDPSKGNVTISHGLVKSLKWPAMTMSFIVKDKMLFDKLTVDKKVSVKFEKQDADYVVTAVK